MLRIFHAPTSHLEHHKFPREFSSSHNQTETAYPRLLILTGHQSLPNCLFCAVCEHVQTHPCMLKNQDINNDKLKMNQIICLYEAIMYIVIIL